MEQGRRTVCFDRELGIEAYRFEGILQIFPGHFHEYYTVSFIEAGLQHAVCQGADCRVSAGDVILFNPGEVHACEPVDGRTLDYRGLNIPLDVMAEVVKEVTLSEKKLHFSQPFLPQCELASSLRTLHRMVMEEESGLGKEETFLLLMGQLITEYADLAEDALEEHTGTVDKMCTWLEEHYTERVSLDQLSERSGFNKYRLLRAFTREKGITPYHYLMTVRVGAAKKRLEEGADPLEAALDAGFSDQSHFTRAFKRLIGLTPGQYRDIFREEGVWHGRA